MAAFEHPNVLLMAIAERFKPKALRAGWVREGEIASLAGPVSDNQSCKTRVLMSMPKRYDTAKIHSA
jgi:hypothetical protein